MRFSFFNLVCNAVHGHRDWPEQWRSPEPKPSYETVIVGAGGHGLGTAYYLAKEHGLRNVAVVDKGWLGGGNTGRNTTIIRSNYLQEESEAIYEHGMKLWQTLSEELNYNVMYSPRGAGEGALSAAEYLGEAPLSRTRSGGAKARRHGAA